MFFASSARECPGSFIKMDSKEVISLAEKTIACIKKARAQRLAALIKREREDMMKGFWFRFFKKPTPSDQEVINYHESKSFFSEIELIKMSYSTCEKIANRLINAAQRVAEVYISAEDLGRIS